jgi:hypothetical protein
MRTLEDDVRGMVSVRDPHEPLRLRLSGRLLPEPSPVATELQRLVLERSMPLSPTIEERQTDA